VGAGVAGLLCARELYRAGWEVLLLEASDGIGGRVRTDVVDGFRLDRGFQALFTGYPAVRRQIDVKALKPRAFDAGIILVEGGHWHELADPWADPKAVVPTLLSAVPTAGDKRLAMRLRRDLRRKDVREVLGDGHVAAAQFLDRYGFSARFIDLFVRGVFGGLFFDPSLSFSASSFLFEYKMLSSGPAVLPAAGMQAIAEQIAADLPEGAVRLECPVLRLERSGDRVLGVQTSREGLEADAVVLAAHAPEAERLAGIPLPKEAYGCTCLYFHVPCPLYGHKKVVVSGYQDGFVHHAVELTNVAPSYAPAPEHLLAAIMLGAPDMGLEELAQRTLDDLQRWFPWRRLRDLTPLAAYQVPFGRLALPPGFEGCRLSSRAGALGLYLAGEYLEGNSLNAALTSGERAAQAVIEDSAKSRA